MLKPHSRTHFLSTWSKGWKRRRSWYLSQRCMMGNWSRFPELPSWHEHKATSAAETVANCRSAPQTSRCEPQEMRSSVILGTWSFSSIQVLLITSHLLHVHVKQGVSLFWALSSAASAVLVEHYTCVSGWEPCEAPQTSLVDWILRNAGYWRHANVFHRTISASRSTTCRWKHIKDAWVCVYLCVCALSSERDRGLMSCVYLLNLL